MYNVYGFGKRIASYRKMLGMTQEELAGKLNITAQAVSKWENELSFPEITILPFLASALNTTIEKLFGGEEERTGNGTNKQFYAPVFPDKKGENLRLVHSLGGVTCYSEKEVDVKNQDTVFFKDGSSADLRNLTVVNKGAGEICFDFIDEILLCNPNIDMSKSEISESYDNIHSVEIFANNADFSLVRSKDNTTHIKATGSPVFIAGLKIHRGNGTLSIKCDDNNSSMNLSGSNKVAIMFGCDRGKSINACVNGSGGITVDLPFDRGHASINGSGDIKFADINSFEGRINGSGDIHCGKIGDSQININGSGDFDAKEVTGFVKSKINGSGDISLVDGELDFLEVKISGSGHFDASEISTKKANLSIDGAGNIVIGRVIEESIEKHSKHSSIKVLKRG